MKTVASPTGIAHLSFTRRTRRALTRALGAVTRMPAADLASNATLPWRAARAMLMVAALNVRVVLERFWSGLGDAPG